MVCSGTALPLLYKQDQLTVQISPDVLKQSERFLYDIFKLGYKMFGFAWVIIDLVDFQTLMHKTSQ
jgi:hypothetical protein